MISSNLSTGFLTHNLRFCYIWGLLYDIFECSIYHSYYLQAFYRLCRVVFYKKKNLLSYSLYITLIVSQWLLIIILLLPPIFLNWYIQIPTEQFCLVPYTDVVAEVYHILILYVIPLLCIGISYLWITKFIRKSSHSRAITLATQQRQRNRRDLTIIKRIAILMLVLVVLRFPTVVFMIYAISIGHLYSLTFSIVGVITSACLISIGFMIIYITPQIQKHLFLGLMQHGNQINVQLPHLTIPTTIEINFATQQRKQLMTISKNIVVDQKP
ncbi:unnamed protein product [Rotaria sp. Silwood2]|nr:unnamed protein product [Rotaria sp. Silwood2]